MGAVGIGELVLIILMLGLFIWIPILIGKSLIRYWFKMKNKKDW